MSSQASLPGAASLKSKRKPHQNLPKTDQELWLRLTPTSLSPSYECDDSEIELEIQAKLETMKLAEKAEKSSGKVDDDAKLMTAVDWSDLSRANITPSISTPKHAKGRLKLTMDKIQDSSIVVTHHEPHTETARKHTGFISHAPSVQVKTHDLWENDGWEDFDSIPKPSSPSISKISAPPAKPNLSSVKPQRSRMKSTEEQRSEPDMTSCS